jgi:uncharacterized phage infection (PIP) family protein YhgE
LPTVAGGIDAGSRIGSTTIDAGSTTFGEGSTTIDAGSRTVGTGSATIDAGSRTIDAGSRAIDAGSRTIDAGSRAIDAGTVGGRISCGAGSIFTGSIGKTKSLRFFTPPREQT